MSRPRFLADHELNTMPGHAYARMADGKPMVGLLMIRQTDPIGPIFDSLVLIWAASELADWESQVCFLPL